jgi:hypothetical protein
MDDARWVRFAAAMGVVFLVLVVVAAQLQGSRPSLDDSPRKIFDYVKNHQSDLQASAALFAAAMVAVLFWAWGLFSILHKAENGRSGLAVVALGGGVLAAAMVIASSVVLATTALRIDGLGASGARTFFTLSQLFLAGTNLGLAVLIGAAAIVSLRRQLFAGWLTIVSIVLALFALVGGMAVAYAGDAIQIIGGLSLVFAGVWFVLVSVRLWRTPEVALAGIVGP